MNIKEKKRYIFIDFENLKKVKFKKLEKVCDRMFILVDADEKSIPFPLVRQVQRLGKAIKWIPIANPSDGDMNYHIAFLMGRLHQKVKREIEFAILSDERSFDPLVNFINASGRACLRVKSRKKEEQTNDNNNKVVLPPTNGNGLSSYESEHEGKQVKDPVSPFALDSHDPSGRVKKTAKETIARLIRSGNRPVELDMLRNYILLHNQELAEQSNVDRIIAQLEKDNNINLSEGEVIYNF